MQPIDAVISWVDGYDPAYQQKLKSYCDALGIEQERAVEPTRIQQCNEIHYCLHSLQRFAPWLRTIYLVTNQQIPPTVSELSGTPFGDKIKIIDQNDLLREQHITTPIFNSLSVEWLIWKIKGLSDHFIYLNDDFFIIKAVEPEDFFRHNKLVLRGEWRILAQQKLVYRMKKQLLSWFGMEAAPLDIPAHRAWQEASARLAGFDSAFYQLPHAPFPLNKATFIDKVTAEPHWIEDNASYPFRHANQLSSIPWMVHLDIQQQRAVFDSKSSVIMVNGATQSLKKIKRRLSKAKRNKRVAFVCMQSIDQAAQDIREYMLTWLKQQLI